MKKVYVNRQIQRNGLVALLFCLFVVVFVGCGNENVDELSENFEGKTFGELLTEADTVCFIGDSLTAGSNNDMHPWYEPMMDVYDATIVNCSWGGATTDTLLENKVLITDVKADVFVIAIGTNDIRFRDPDNGAQTAEEYIANLTELREGILKKNSDASFVFVTPWYSTDFDTVSKLPYEEKLAMNREYSNALYDFCVRTKSLYIDPTDVIVQTIQGHETEYLVDYIHPNEAGVKVYFEAVLNY